MNRCKTKSRSHFRGRKLSSSSLLLEIIVIVVRHLPLNWTLQTFVLSERFAAFEIGVESLYSVIGRLSGGWPHETHIDGICVGICSPFSITFHSACCTTIKLGLSTMTHIMGHRKFFRWLVQIAVYNLLPFIHLCLALFHLVDQKLMSREVISLECMSPSRCHRRLVAMVISYLVRALLDDSYVCWHRG